MWASSMAEAYATVDDLTLSLNEQAFHDTITSLKSFAGYVLPSVVRHNIIRTYWRYFDIRQAEKNLDERSRSAYQTYLKRIEELTTRIRYGGRHADSPGRPYDFDVFCRHPNDSGYERVVYDRHADGTETHYYKPVLSQNTDRRTTQQTSQSEHNVLRRKRPTATTTTVREVKILRKGTDDLRRRPITLAVDDLSNDDKERSDRDRRSTVTSVEPMVEKEDDVTFCNEQFEDWIDSITTGSTPGISRTSYDLSCVAESSSSTTDGIRGPRIYRSELQRLLETGIRDDETLRRAARASRRTDV